MNMLLEKILIVIDYKDITRKFQIFKVAFILLAI